MHSPNRAIIVLTVSLVIAIAVACNCPCHRVAFVPRQRWSARPSTSTDYQLRPVRYVIVHHTATVTCSTKSTCSRIISRIQAFHMERMDYDDIGYNFLIGNDGRIYEGVGWHIVGAHTYRYNRNGLGIAFIGDFNDELPTEAALNAAKDLIHCGVRNGELDRDYRLFAGRQLMATDSPGIELYGEMQDWDHWATGT